MGRAVTKNKIKTQEDMKLESKWGIVGFLHEQNKLIQAELRVKKAGLFARGREKKGSQMSKFHHEEHLRGLSLWAGSSG